MFLIGCGNIYLNIINWIEKEFDKNESNLVLVGTNGCGKTELIKYICKTNQTHNFIYFDCFEKINKKSIIERLNKEKEHNDIVDIFKGIKKEKICIMDEIDGIIDTENISINDIKQFLDENQIKTIFITTYKGLNKIKISGSKVVKMGMYNKNEIISYFQKKYSKKIYKKDIEMLIKKHGDNISSIQKEIEFGVFDKVSEIKQDDFDLYNKLNFIKKNKLDESLIIIESDIMNLVFCIHENYSLLTKDYKHYIKILNGLYNIDKIYNYMFENQIWEVNKYSYIELYDITKVLQLKNQNLKTGTLWSKYSNWQYKKKLYNNFSFYQSNCIFYNMDFVFSFHSKIIKSLINNINNIDDCISLCVLLNIDFIKFEQLLRICPVYDEFKGSTKNKFLKKLRNI